jgi:MFS family permease
MWTWPPVALTLLLASTLTVMSGATISPALPRIAAAFADEPNAEFLVRLVLTIPALFIVVGGPIAGWIVDTQGRRTLFLVALAGYAAAGVSGAFAGSLTELLIGRALLGISVAGVMTASTTLLIDSFEGPARMKLLGSQAAFASGGGVVFVLAGGALSEVGWQAPFYIYLFSLVVLALAVLYIPEPPRAVAPVGPQAGTRMPLVWAIYAAGFMSQVAFYSIPLQLPFLLKEEYGVTGTGAGFAIAVSTLFMAATSLNFFRLRTWMDYPRFITLAFAMMGVGFIVIAASHTLALMLVGLAVVGTSFGLLMPPSSSWLSELASLSNRGRVMGGMGTAIFLGQFLSPVITAPIWDSGNYHFAYSLTGGALLAAALGSVFVLRRVQRVNAP